MTKITLDELKAKLKDSAIPGYEIDMFFTPVPGRPFSPGMTFNPETVEIPEGLTGDALRGLANEIVRGWRQGAFLRRLDNGDRRPVLVAEGDSWFHFPLPDTHDIVEQLSGDYSIWTVAGAGDTADDMVRSKEYVGALAQNVDRVVGFLFSAAGNDVIGANESNNAAISRLLKSRQRGADDAASHVDRAALAQVLGKLERNYDEVVKTIRANPRLKRLPIFIHGYDYAVPGGYPQDPRPKKIYANQGKWLGDPMRAKGITETSLQRKIIVALIDALYQMLDRVAQKHRNVYVVNLRRKLTDVWQDWEDEIHGTTYGFGNIASKFKEDIDRVLRVA